MIAYTYRWSISDVLQHMWSVNKNEGALLSMSKQQWKETESLWVYQNLKVIFKNFLKYFVDFLFSLVFIYVQFHISNYPLRKDLQKYIWNKKSSCSFYDLIHSRQYQKSHEKNVLTWDF